MARKKRGSKVYDKALIRKAALASIDPALDLGNGLTIVAYEAKIGATKGTMDAYNTVLSQSDEKQNLLTDSEKELRNWNERMLAGVASKYGKDSNEYEKAGGVKKSLRKHPVSKKAKEAKA